MNRRTLVQRMVLATSLTAFCAGSALAQSSPLRVRKISMDARVRTPEYKVERTSQQPSRKAWFQLQLEYETAPDWVDELEFTFYILMKTRDNPREPYILFRDTISYIDVPKGRHLATAFLHPHTQLRYGDVERVGVEIKVQGRLIARASEPSANQPWWEQLSPRSGYILNRQQTPFAFVNPDAYEAIKSSQAGR